MQVYLDALAQQAVWDISCLSSMWMLLIWWFFIPFLMVKWSVLTMPVWVPIAILVNMVRAD